MQMPINTLLFCFLCCFSITVLGQNDNLVEGKYNENGEQQGAWKYYYPNQVIRLEGLYANGNREGEWFQYDSAGRISHIINYKNSKLHGISTEYENGNPIFETYFKNGIADSLRVDYYDNRKFKVKASFKYGVPNNKWAEFYENGNTAISLTYKAGMKHGLAMHYFEDGKKMNEQ